MKPSKTSRRGIKSWAGGAIVSALAALLGMLCQYPIGDGVARLSYDLPFAMRGNIRVDEVAIVYLDRRSFTELEQPVNVPLDRKFHARLIKKLTAEGAKAAVFDILMSGPSEDPASDEELAKAIRDSGRGILVGDLSSDETAPGVVGQKEETPYPPFLAGAAGWGNDNFRPDPDSAIRFHLSSQSNVAGQTNVPWMPWAVAQFVGAPVTKLNPPPAAMRWMNYYGPPNSLPGYSYCQALAPDGVPPGFFKNKVVFVGGRLAVEVFGKNKDEFATPYTRWTRHFATGVEIHATAFLNLLRGDWLARLPFAAELAVMWGFGALAGFGLVRLRPLPATMATLAGIVAVTIGAHELVLHANIWFAWIALILQLVLCLFCSVIYNSLQLYIEKRVFEQSVAARLSPGVARRLLQDPSLRQPGGSKQEVSILFSDIANFSRVSESMHAEDLINLLNRYYAAALQSIHETDGTVIDLIGDAIFAIWNAPLEQADHRERACQAALKLHQQVVRFDAQERSLPMRTRVGLHAGTVIVGNIGSAARFNYTAIGEDVNLASRLEGLNKHIGTSVLATREVQRASEDKLLSRPVGHFKFKGFGRAVEIHELIGTLGAAEASRAWREKFADALQEFRQRKWDAAEAAFLETISLRKAADAKTLEAAGTVAAPPSTGIVSKSGLAADGDGPSLFYLGKIVELRLQPPAYEWIGEVAMGEK